jgi:outer membrane biosynthesis protein TonB
MKESVSEVPVSLEKKQEFVPPVPRHEDILENFEDLKMKDSVSEVPVSLEKEHEFVAESKSPKKSKIPKEDLLKELEQLAKLDASYVLVPDVEKEEAGVEEKIQKGGESFDSVIKKLGSFSIDSEPVKVEISITQLDSSDFQSNLRNLPQVSQSAVDLGAGNSFVGTKKEGLPGADIQSLYVGKIRKRIMKNWREPLAQEYNQESVISFFIFRGGNIDKPHIKRSSGVKELDTLAVRAVLDSVPFPEFPKDLKASNLHLEMYFKYVPKDE